MKPLNRNNWLDYCTPSSLFLNSPRRNLLQDTWFGILIRMGDVIEGFSMLDVYIIGLDGLVRMLSSFRYGYSGLEAFIS